MLIQTITNHFLEKPSVKSRKDFIIYCCKPNAINHLGMLQFPPTFWASRTNEALELIMAVFTRLL
jgi:hypothetical protein